jgi:peroxiredoxin
MDPLARLGEPAPDFTLPDLTGAPHHLGTLRGEIVVLVFWSADCAHSERSNRTLAALRPVWGERAHVWWVASNPNESLERLRDAALGEQIGPVLLDGDQSVAERYGAVTTPHVFVIGADGVLRYAGAPDDVDLRRPTPTRGYLAQAVEALLAGRHPEPAETPPFGCALVRGRRSGESVGEVPDFR